MTGQSGSAGALPILAGLAVTGVTAVMGSLVAGAVTHSRVEVAADMVALAAASHLLEADDPCAVAAATAGDNGVELVGCSVVGVAVTVTVSHALPPVLRQVLPGRTAEGTSRAELRVHSSSS